LKSLQFGATAVCAKNKVKKKSGRKARIKIGGGAGRRLRKVNMRVRKSLVPQKSGHKTL